MTFECVSGVNSFVVCMMIPVTVNVVCDSIGSSRVFHFTLSIKVFFVRPILWKESTSAIELME